jgi:hypothetical protein
MKPDSPPKYFVLSIGALNVMETVVAVGTLVAPSAGVVDVTVSWAMARAAVKMNNPKRATKRMVSSVIDR